MLGYKAREEQSSARDQSTLVDGPFTLWVQINHAAKVHKTKYLPKEHLPTGLPKVAAAFRM